MGGSQHARTVQTKTKKVIEASVLHGVNFKNSYLLSEMANFGFNFLESIDPEICLEVH